MNREEKWEHMYNLLVDYKNKYGDTEVPVYYVTPSGKKLGSWVDTQRKSYKNNMLYVDRMEKLQQIGFNFEINRCELKWEHMYNLLIEYINKYGNTEVSPRYVTSNGEKLGSWAARQRELYRENKLSMDRMEKLKQLDFRFENIDYNARWNYMYNLLLEYKDEYGNVNVPGSYVTVKGEALGSWAARQRELYRENKLSMDRMEKLKQLDFRFENIDYNARWNYMYNLLLEYRNKYGNVEVPLSYITSSGERLGSWILMQRQLYKNNKMPIDRLEKLKQIDFRFDNIYLNARWDYMCNLLVKYKKKYGNTEVAKSYVTANGEKLGLWVYNQRVSYRNNELSKDRTDKLLAVGFAFNNSNNRIKALCLSHNIDYEKYKVVLDKLTYNEFASRLYYLLDNYIELVDNNDRLHPIFDMNDDELYLFTDATQTELNKYYFKDFMFDLIDGYYDRVENKSSIKVRKRK